MFGQQRQTMLYKHIIDILLLNIFYSCCRMPIHSKGKSRLQPKNKNPHDNNYKGGVLPFLQNFWKKPSSSLVTQDAKGVNVRHDGQLIRLFGNYGTSKYTGSPVLHNKAEPSIKKKKSNQKDTKVKNNTNDTRGVNVKFNGQLVRPSGNY